MRKRLQKGVVIVIFLLLCFLQPHILCHRKQPADGKNELPAWLNDPPAETGLWQPYKQPDEVLASSVKLKPGAKEAGYEAMKQLEKINGPDYVFSSSKGLKNLKTGDFVFFRNHSVKKITGVEEKKGKYIVKTSPCRFIDVFSDAHIHFREKFTWQDNARAMIQQLGLSFGSFALAQGNSTSLSWKGKAAGYDIAVKLEPAADSKLKFSINMKQERKANITFSGFISSYEHETEIRVEDSRLTLLRSGNRNLKGEVQVQFAAVELGEKGALINLPYTWFQRPLLIGGIPFVLKLKSNIKVFPSIGKNSSSQGHYKMIFDTDMGFKFEMGKVFPEGRVNNHDFIVAGETLSASMLGNGIGLGAEVPRFELSSLGEVIVPYFLMNIAAESVLDTYAPCQMGKMEAKLVAGLQLQFFGLSYKAETKLWNKKKRWTTATSKCPPEKD